MFAGITHINDREWAERLYAVDERVGFGSTYETEQMKVLLKPIAIRLQEILERLEKLENDLSQCKRS